MIKLAEVDKLLSILDQETREISLQEFAEQLGLPNSPVVIKNLASAIRLTGHTVKRKSEWDTETQTSKSVMYVKPN